MIIHPSNLSAADCCQNCEKVIEQKGCLALMIWRGPSSPSVFHRSVGQQNLIALSDVRRTDTNPHSVHMHSSSAFTAKHWWRVPPEGGRGVASLAGSQYEKPALERQFDNPVSQLRRPFLGSLIAHEFDTDHQPQGFPRTSTRALEAAMSSGRRAGHAGAQRHTAGDSLGYCHNVRPRNETSHGA